MKRWIIVGAVLIFTTNVSAQDEENLIENPGFEQTVGKIKRGGSISNAVGWMSPTRTAADLFSSKMKGEYGTPTNTYGNEDPYEGKNYAGFRSFSYNNKEPRNYISTRLKMPLRRGAKYCVTFYVSLAEGSKYATNSIGVNFSKKQYNIPEDKNIVSPTHAQHKDNPVFNGLFGWDQVCNVYTAQGGEKFMTLGNFYSNGETKNERLKKPKGFSGTSVMSAYYYVDNVSVRMIESEDECECEADSDDQEVVVIYNQAPVDPEGLDPQDICEYTAVHFARGAYKLNDEDVSHLENIAFVLNKYPNSKVKLVAHSDQREDQTDQYGEMDQKRAVECKKWLTEKGISGDRLIVETKGYESPVKTASTEQDQAENRRVNFIYLR